MQTSSGPVIPQSVCHIHLVISVTDRTVDPLDIVVDVGGVYSPEKHRYDHHQRGFTEVFGYGGFDKTKLSSAGLVYKYVSTMNSADE
jgi:uncharacterized UPF0160 family protein